MTEKNWAGNLAYSAARIHTPASVDELQDIVRRVSHARALGSRHSFNTIADTPDDLISLAQLKRVLAIDTPTHTVTIEGGITYGELAPQLERAGLAVHNLASLPHISVAGACATATHGSGVHNQNLAAAVSAMEIVTATGDLISCSRAEDAEKFEGKVVALGALGIVTQLTLSVIDSFQVRQDVYENLPLTALESDYAAIMASGYSVSLFTDWQTDTFNQVWRKRRVTAGDVPERAEPFFGAAPAAIELHPIAQISPVSCTPQLGVPGPWHERLPHFRMDFTPSSGEELQTEFFVPQRHAVRAIQAVSRLAPQIAPLLHISEIRTIAADSLWLSPCYQEPCTAIHFTWKPDWENVRALLPKLEEVLSAFAARPHWGKLFTMSPSYVQSLYPRLRDFRALAESLDPYGKFRNAFVTQYLFS